MIIDPRRKRMLFQPYDSAAHVTIGNKQTEKAIINKDGLPVVGLVWERSEAWQAGLRQGDTILKADGQPIHSFSEYVAFRPLRGRIYTVTARDKRGFLKEINMRW
jgi:C-terminal processing protease CtpA/Prc